MAARSLQQRVFVKGLISVKAMDEILKNAVPACGECGQRGVGAAPPPRLGKQSNKTVGVCVCVALFNSTNLLFNLVAWCKMESFVVTIKQVDKVRK